MDRSRSLCSSWYYSGYGKHHRSQGSGHSGHATLDDLFRKSLQTHKGADGIGKIISNFIHFCYHSLYKMHLDLTIAIPVRNEHKNLPGCLAAIGKGFAQKIVVMDSA